MLTLRDIMTRNVLTLSPDTSVRRAMDLFATHHLSGAPVVAGDEVVGVVSTTDLLGFAAGLPDQQELPSLDAAAEPASWDDLPAWELDAAEEIPAAFFAQALSGGEVDTAMGAAARNLPASALDEHTVDEIMTRRLCVLPSESDVVSAAAFMSDAGIHRVLVLDDGELVGLVSTMDITRAVGDANVPLPPVLRPPSAD